MKTKRQIEQRREEEKVDWYTYNELLKNKERQETRDEQKRTQGWIEALNWVLENKKEENK